jgi:hypothetical protein
MDVQSEVDKMSIFKKIKMGNSGRRGTSLGECTPDAFSERHERFLETISWNFNRTVGPHTVETVMCKTPAISATQTHSAE